MIRPGSKLPLALLALSLAAVLGCPAAPPAPVAVAAPAADPEADRNAVIAVHLALIDAYESGDVESFISRLEPTAELLMFHPRVENRFDGIAEVRQNFQRMNARIGSSTWSDLHAEVHVRGDVAWLTSQILIESERLDAPFVGRATELFVRNPDGWKLIHGHWSAVPS